MGTRDYVTGKIWDLSKRTPGGKSARDGTYDESLGKKKYPVRLILNGQASQEIEWHCKHYVGRGLMKRSVGFRFDRVEADRLVLDRFESGEAVAKEIGISPSALKATFDKYNEGARNKNDPFGKRVCFHVSFRHLLTI